MATKPFALHKTIFLLIAIGLAACAQASQLPPSPAIFTPMPGTSSVASFTPTNSPTPRLSRTPTQHKPTSTPILPSPTPVFSSGVQRVKRWEQRFDDAVWQGDELLALRPTVSEFGEPVDLIRWDAAQNATALPDLQMNAQATATMQAYEKSSATRAADMALGRVYFHNRQYYLTCDQAQTTFIFRTSGEQLIAKLPESCYPADRFNKEPFFYIAWAPDNTRLAFASQAHLGILKLVDGSIQTLSAFVISTQGDSALSWSPDSKRIAYLHPGDYAGEAKLGIIDAVGDKPPLIFETVIGVGNQDTSLSWDLAPVIKTTVCCGLAIYTTLYSVLTGEEIASWERTYTSYNYLQSTFIGINLPSPDERWLVIESGGYIDSSYRVVDLQTGTSIKLLDQSTGQMHFSHWATNSHSFYYAFYSHNAGTGGLYVFDTAQLTTTLLAENILRIWPGPSPNLFWALAAGDEVAFKRPVGMGLFDLQQRRWVKPPQIFLPDTSNLELLQWQLSFWSVAKDGQTAAFIDRDQRTLNLITPDSSRVLVSNLPLTHTNPEGVGVALSPSGKFVFVNLKNEAWLLRID